jgi:hypothetical protein
MILYVVAYLAVGFLLSSLFVRLGQSNPTTNDFLVVMLLWAFLLPILLCIGIWRLFDGKFQAYLNMLASK